MPGSPAHGRGVDLDSPRGGLAYFREFVFRAMKERRDGMFSAAISQFTTPRWDVGCEIARCVAHGFDALSMWRPKFSDIPPATVGSMLATAGVRAASVQWAGGFTGADGRSFAESVADAIEAIDCARVLGAPVVVLHSGCRGGHTRSHAHRLLAHAIEALLPVADQAGVTLAIKPVHEATAADCSFLTTLPDALDMIAECRAGAGGRGHVALALDLWHFADAPDLDKLLPALAATTAVVQVADRIGPPTPDQERLPPGSGGLPLEATVRRLVDVGFIGSFELDPVGEEVESRGYDAVLADLRRVADEWSAIAASGDTSALRGPRQRLRAGSGARRSHASSQAVSPG